MPGFVVRREYEYAGIRIESIEHIRTVYLAAASRSQSHNMVLYYKLYKPAVEHISKCKDFIGNL